jgi:hypothetical protein
MGSFCINYVFHYFIFPSLCFFSYFLIKNINVMDGADVHILFPLHHDSLSDLSTYRLLYWSTAFFRAVTNDPMHEPWSRESTDNCIITWSRHATVHPNYPVWWNSVPNAAPTLFPHLPLYVASKCFDSHLWMIFCLYTLCQKHFFFPFWFTGCCMLVVIFTLFLFPQVLLWGLLG